MYSILWNNNILCNIFFYVKLLVLENEYSLYWIIVLANVNIVVTMFEMLFTTDDVISNSSQLLICGARQLFDRDRDTQEWIL